MNRLFLHIGPHKTGSSYIQKTLFDNRSSLTAAGLDYPDAGIEFLWGHHALAAALQRGQWEEARRYTQALAHFEHDVLLSSEDFSQLSGEALTAFAELLGECCGGAGISVIFVRRIAEELLVSTWQERVKNGDTRSWERFFFDHLSRPEVSDIINLINVMQRYEECFGNAAPVVLDYDAVRRSGEDLFDVFAQALGHEALRGLGSREVVNARMPLAQIEIIRLLNVMATASGRPSDCRISGSLRRYLEAKPDCAAHQQLLTLIECRSERVELSGLPVFTEFARRFDARYGHRVVNPIADDGDPARRAELRLPRRDIIANESSMRLLRLLEAGAQRFYTE